MVNISLALSYTEDIKWTTGGPSLLAHDKENIPLYREERALA